MKTIIKFFDHLEDRIRSAFSHYPILYAFIGGVFMILFWRGVWHTADILQGKGGIWAVLFYEPFSIVWLTIGMLLIGLFVSFFIGDHIVMSGLKQEKKLTEKTQREIMEETTQIERIENKIIEIEEDLLDIKDDLQTKQ